MSLLLYCGTVWWRAKYQAVGEARSGTNFLREKFKSNSQQIGMSACTTYVCDKVKKYKLVRIQ